MSASRVPKVAGIDPAIAGVAHNHLPDQSEQPSLDPASAASEGFTDAVRPVDQLAAAQDRLATWISDLTTLHELTERLAGTVTLDAALEELLRAGASLVGARRGLAVLEPSDGLGPQSSVGYGLLRADLGTIETIPGGAASYGRLLGGQ